MVAGPGDELAAAAAGRGRLRASDADREQVIGILKAAFAQGMLAKDEFDLRVSQAFASRTYAELAAVTAGVSAGPGAARLPGVRAQGRQPVLRAGRMMAAATALWAGAQAFVFLSPWPAGTASDPSHARIALLFYSDLTYLCVLLIGVVYVAGCGVETFRRAAAAAASVRYGRPGIPAAAMSRPGGRFRRPVTVTGSRRS